MGLMAIIMGTLLSKIRSIIVSVFTLSRDDVIIAEVDDADVNQPSPEQKTDDRDIVKAIGLAVSAELQRRSRESDWNRFRWPSEPDRIGSYYERTRVNAGGDYDLTFPCRFRYKSVLYADTLSNIYFNCPPIDSYCAIVATKQLLGLSNSILVSKVRTSSGNSDIFISPKGFYTLFRETVSKALKCSRRLENCNIDIQPDQGTSPAVTIRVNDKFDVDLAPALVITSWPEPAGNWKSTWLNADVVKNIKEDGVHAVAKPHPCEYNKPCEERILWRLSFHKAEKKILLHADGLLSEKSSAKTCRKDVYRELKKMVQSFYDERQESGAVTSYCVKTIMLHLFDRYLAWNVHLRSQRLKQAIIELTASLNEGKLQHYFIPRDNILSLKELKKRERKEIIEHLRRYSRYSGTIGDGVAADTNWVKKRSTI